MPPRCKKILQSGTDGRQDFVWPIDILSFLPTKQASVRNEEVVNKLPSFQKMPFYCQGWEPSIKNVGRSLSLPLVKILLMQLISIMIRIWANPFPPKCERHWKMIPCFVQKDLKWNRTRIVTKGTHGIRWKGEMARSARSKGSSQHQFDGLYF